MEYLQHFFATTGQLLLSGAAGGLVRWTTLKQHWRDGLISVAFGSLLALYVGRSQSAGWRNWCLLPAPRPNRPSSWHCSCFFLS
jgi:hypothetical protein